MEDIRFRESRSPEADRRWFACYTRGRHEKKVARLLGEYGLDHYLPLVARTSRWSDRTRTIEDPLFPSYVFAHVVATELGHVTSLPGVASIVRSMGQPLAIPEAEIENVRNFVQVLNSGGARVEPELLPLPERGSRVRVSSGPFAGVTGIVLEHRGRSRILVGLDAVGMGVAVDLRSVSIEPI